MFQHCMVGMIFFILQTGKQILEGNKELGQKHNDRAQNDRARLASTPACHQTCGYHQHCTARGFIYTVGLWQKRNCTLKIIAPVSSKEPRNLRQ